MQLGNGFPYGGASGASSMNATGGQPFGMMAGGFAGANVTGGTSGAPSFGGSPGGGFGNGGIGGAAGIGMGGIGAGGFPSSSGGIGGGFGAGGFPATGGLPSTGGVAGMSAGGLPATGGMSNDTGGTSPMSGGAGGMSGGDPETGRLVGITAAHNAVRAAVMTTTPLVPFTWSPTIAAYAQQWADSLAMTSCSSPHHRTSAELQQVGYGENLAAFSSGGFGAMSSTAQDAVDGWAAEKSCWTYGAFDRGDQCNMSCYEMLNSDGCGHYTQIVWRASMQLGCGVSSCMQGNFKTDIWICNYAPAGNYVGQTPY